MDLRVADIDDLQSGDMGRKIRRAEWQIQRLAREKALGGRPAPWLTTYWFRFAARLAWLMLRATGLHRLGKRNAETIAIEHHELAFSSLPRAFDGYRILQISDLHFDCLPEVRAIVARLAATQPVELCLLTGDYADNEATPIQQTVSALKEMAASIRASDGVMAVLGNHDSARLVEPIEDLGIQMVINETVTVQRGDAQIYVTGLDDVSTFETPQAHQALTQAREGFKIAAVHSPDVADLAARAGYALYLSGHTHGGQIRLPFLPPAFTGLRRLRRLHTGKWELGQMVGYTNRGAGVSNLPLRFNAPPEITIFTLRRLAPLNGPSKWLEARL
jgi:uncharacterized protein